MPRKLSVDDIDLALLPNDARVEQGRAVIKMLLESIPIIGRVFEVRNTVNDAKQQVEREEKLAMILNDMWIQLKTLEGRMEALDESAANEVAKALSQESRLQVNDIIVVLDSCLGLAAVMNLPDKHVPAELITKELIDAYVDIARDEDVREQMILDANRMRASMGDLGDNQKKRIVLGDLKTQSARAFWTSAFEKGRVLGGRMVACLLLVLDSSALDERWKHAYDTLFDFLTEGDPTSVRA